MASIYQTAIDQELNHLATQASSFLDRLYPAGKLAQVCVFLICFRDGRKRCQGNKDQKNSSFPTAGYIAIP